MICREAGRSGFATSSRCRNSGLNTGGWTSLRCSSSSISSTWSRRDLADPEWIERGARRDQADHVLKSLEIDQVLREAAGSEHPRRNVERGFARQAVAVGESRDRRRRTRRRRASHRPRPRGPASRRRRAGGQPADRPFRENAESFLHAFIMGKAGTENREPLGSAVEVGEQVDADLVREQGVDAVTAGIAVLLAIISLRPRPAGC